MSKEYYVVTPEFYREAHKIIKQFKSLSDNEFSKTVESPRWQAIEDYITKLDNPTEEINMIGLAAIDLYFND